MNPTKIMEEVASDNRTHMLAIGKEYQEMVNQLIKVRRVSETNFATVDTIMAVRCQTKVFHLNVRNCVHHVYNGSSTM